MLGTYVAKVLHEKNQYTVVATITKSGVELTSPTIVKGVQTESMWFLKNDAYGYLFWMIPQILSPGDSITVFLDRILSTKQALCRYIIYKILYRASQGKVGIIVVDSDENSSPASSRCPAHTNRVKALLEHVSKKQKLIIEVESSATGKALLWRHEKTGSVGFKLKWSFHPIFVTNRDERHQGSIETSISINHDAMKILVEVLESRAVPEVKQKK